jgi:hypothetical protein
MSGIAGPFLIVIAYVLTAIMSMCLGLFLGASAQARRIADAVEETDQLVASLIDHHCFLGPVMRLPDKRIKLKLMIDVKRLPWRNNTKVYAGPKSVDVEGSTFTCALAAALRQVKELTGNWEMYQAIGSVGPLTARKA